MSGTSKRYRAGDRLEDLCRACKIDRRHTVMAATPEGVPVRVVCDYCGSLHNYRGGPRGGLQKTGPAHSTRAPIEPVPVEKRGGSAMSHEQAPGNQDLESMLRRVIREEGGLTPVAPAEKWRGGQLVLRPGREGVQEKVWPIDGFFHKVVMVRNRLRILEQQINGADLPEDQKIKLQAYITACYGSLTSFNVLFADAGDRFRGSGGSD